MADEVRLIDANSVCKKIVESIRCAEEWANEADEQQDTHGLRRAIEAKTSLLAMLTRIHDEPTVEAKPDNGWISVWHRMPEDGVLVLVAFAVDYGFGATKTIIDTAMHQPCGFCGGGYDNFRTLFCNTEITHWMPLPQKPESEDDAEL